MQDVRGHEIGVGDTIVTSKQSTRRGAHQGVEIAVVESFTPQKVKTNKGRTHFPCDVVILEKAVSLVHNDAQMDMGV